MDHNKVIVLLLNKYRQELQQHYNERKEISRRDIAI